MTENRRWLVQTFTGADLDAAEGHEAGAEHRNPYASENAGDGDIHDAKAAAAAQAPRRRNSKEMDEFLRDVLQSPDVAPLMERSGKFDFDALAFYELPTIKWQPLQYLGAHLLQTNELVTLLTSQGKVPAAFERKFESCMLRFFGKVDEMYLPEQEYHHAGHAADVMMTMEWFLQTNFMRARVSTLEHVMAMVAGAIHDVGHPGRNNLFLTKTMAPLAVTYNDKSVLENMHVAKCFETMQGDPSLNWFSLLPRKHSEEAGQAHDLQQFVRRGLIDMVLATDMARHADFVRKIEAFAEEVREEGSPASQSVEELAACKPPAAKQVALEKKLLLLETILHAADISNPCKPRPIMLRWTQKILAEFWAQGDEEKSLGIEVSPLCDRESGRQAVPKGQIGFINFVIRPFYLPIAELIPEAKEAVQELDQNLAFWQDMDGKQAGFEELLALPSPEPAPRRRDAWQ